MFFSCAAGAGSAPLALLFVVLLPANVYAATAHVPFAGQPESPLWQRIPEQALYIAMALWAARGARPGQKLVTRSPSTRSSRAGSVAS